jgi:hypothetical protein
MKTIIAFLLLASTSQAALLSQLTTHAESPTAPASTDIQFYIATWVGGIGPHFVIPGSLPSVNYYAEPQMISSMYNMTINHAQYENHGPVVVGMNVGTSQDPWHKFWYAYVTNIAAPNYISPDLPGLSGGIIHGTPEAMTTPWQGISMSRSDWSWTGSAYTSFLTVSIYDVPIPEPSALLLSMYGTLLCLLRRRRPVC